MRLIPSTALSLAAAAVLLAGCGGQGKGAGGGKTIVGAGSTLVAPIVARWSADYEQRAGVTVTYGSIGSGGGIAQITGRTVDFGASDAPLTPDQAWACDGLAKVSPEWKRREGVSTQVNFPTGVGGKGNEGVAAAVSRTDGGIGYLGISYVFSNHLDYALVENAAGAFPVPGVPSILAAAR